MAQVPTPHGMSEVDYTSIEAAVTETVRGRWFLNEFARRNRTAELRQLLEAMGRIENVVAAGQTALPPADPSIRLLMQRIKEIAGQLETLSYEMREAGVDERFAAAVEKEGRAVSGMMRGPALARPTTGQRQLERDAASSSAHEPPVPLPPMAAATQIGNGVAPAAPASEPAISPAAELPGPTTADDPRLAALLKFDELSLADKLSLFA